MLNGAKLLLSSVSGVFAPCQLSFMLTAQPGFFRIAFVFARIGCMITNIVAKGRIET